MSAKRFPSARVPSVSAAVLLLFGALLILLLLIFSFAESAAAAPAQPGAGQGDGEWTALGGPLAPGGQVNAIAVHPTVSNTLFMAVNYRNAADLGPSRIYKSTTAGDAWTQVATAPVFVGALAVQGANVYAGGAASNGPFGAVYTSNNGGVTWGATYTLPADGAIHSIAAAAGAPQYAVAGGTVRQSERLAGIVAVSNDGGATWQTRTLADPAVNVRVMAVALRPGTPPSIFAALRRGGSPNSVVMRSDDLGLTWPVTATIANRHVVSLALDPEQPNTVFAGTGSTAYSWGDTGIFRTTDGGATWPQVYDHGTYLTAGTSGVIVGAAVWGGVVISLAHGDAGTWSDFFGVEEARAFAQDANAALRTFYLGGAEQGIHRIRSGDTGWTDVNGDVATPVYPVDIEVARSNPNLIFVAARSSGGWRSDDAGATWAQVEWAYSAAFAVNPFDAAIVYNGQYNDRDGPIARSGDGGLTFTRVYTPAYLQPDGSGGHAEVHSLLVAYADPQSVWAGGADYPAGGQRNAFVLRSTNDGQTWAPVYQRSDNSVVNAVAVSPLSKKVVFAGGESCDESGCRGFVARTVNGGDNWEIVHQTDAAVVSLVVEGTGQLVFAGDLNYMVFRSENGGDGWTIVRQYGGPTMPSGYLVRRDPRVPGVVYLAGWGYVAESRDAGETWTGWDDPPNNGTPRMDPGALAVDSGRDPQRLYGGFTGVWVYARAAPGSLVNLPLVGK